MKLIKPEKKYKNQLIKMINDFLSKDYSNYIKYGKALSCFDSYCENLSHREAEYLCITRWLLDNNNIIGVVRIRPNLTTEFLRKEAGNIGYDISPSYRGHGYGKIILKQSVEICKLQLKLKNIIIVSEESNLASIKIIESMDGKLLERYKSIDDGLINLIYNISV